MMKPFLVGVMLAGVICGACARPREVSGIYPHLAMFNDEGECGTGAVVPWADRLWVVTYAPHKPEGSSDKLYEVTPDLRQIIRPESIGGTPANRMIHRESRQLFIGPYAIGADRTVRVIPYSSMFGRPTGMARHLTDPEHRILCASMEEGIYEIDVRSLDVTELWTDEQRPGGRKADLPGYHGKGFYSAQGRYVYANNGDHAQAALVNPAVPSGVLAEWDGAADRWNVVRRNQFTDVTGPGGINGNLPGDDRIWSIGWDHKSLILMLLEGGRWTSYRLPKASHCYDGAHGWNTEWPRIRDVGGKDLLMTMHGSFWTFPKTFSNAKSSGIAPLSTYLKVVGDFCRWGDRVALGCDDTARSEFLNRDRLKGNLAGPGKSQSNLWFVDPARLDRFGPPLGRGAVWLNEDVVAGVPSEPYLFGGFQKRSLFVAHQGVLPACFMVEVDRKGDGRWEKLREIVVPARGSAFVELPTRDAGAWVRLTPAGDSVKVTAMFHYRMEDRRGNRGDRIFSGIPPAGADAGNGGLLHARGGDARTLRMLAHGPDGQPVCYDLDGSLVLKKMDDAAGAAWMGTNVAIPAPVVSADAASVLYVDGRGNRWRLPRGDAAYDRQGGMVTGRMCREVSTERNLLNVHGTFYELPAENAGGFSKIRPIATHNRAIGDYASYRGLLVLSGVMDGAHGEHIVRSEDDRCALWVGAVDDLWKLGKPRGVGGPWKDSPVKAGVPGDPYQMSGYDGKRVLLCHAGSGSINMTLQVDISGSGDWVGYKEEDVAGGKTVEHRFPDGFGAYWVRVVADRDTVATAQFVYE
ncbi:MAG: hypothetical protein WCR20_12015 [Verrucomicrobiota bacterium]